MKLDTRVRMVLLVVTAIMIMFAIYMAFIYAPTHDPMGDVQRIFYFHVASAWIAYLAFGITFAGSLAYLRTKNLKWDNLASASTEAGVVFCTLAIITGPLWAKAVWGVFWQWDDLKLFMTLVLWFVFIAYLILRGNVKHGRNRANLSAVFGILGFMCIPLSFAANRIWSQYHPTVIATSGGSLQSSMLQALIVSVFAFTFLYVNLVLMRLDVKRMRRQLENIKHRAGD